MTAKEKEIEKYMKSLDISREEAEQLWIDDHSDEMTEEQAELEAKAKNFKRYEKSETKKERKPREVKPDETKVFIVAEIANCLDWLNPTIKNIQREITFTYKDEEYSLTLTKHRKPKSQVCGNVK